MRELMREIVDKMYTFQVRFREEPGFLERLGIWEEREQMGRAEDRRFLPVGALLRGGRRDRTLCQDGRFAFAPHPDPVEDMLYQIHAVFEGPDGSHWPVGTDLVTHDLDSGEVLAEALNTKLGFDLETCAAIAQRVFAANPTGLLLLDFPE